MTEHLLTLIQWLIPSGGVGALLVWLTSRTIRSARTAKEVHDTYKQMYEDVQRTLIDLQHKNSQLYATLSRLEQAVSRATLCRYYGAACPLRSELQKHGAQPYTGHLQPASYRSERGQHRPRDGGMDEPSRPLGYGHADPADDRPP